MHKSLLFHFFHDQEDFELLQVERYYQPYVLHSCDAIGVGESFFDTSPIGNTFYNIS